ncbi:hypothetical protein GWI33_015813 [Rhynchophorus ferrugineus]|uniref:Uncharacterized protein n=1 Tax=Rhynchophorus ferrugineus TaxID=354439 RepID=A0A834I2S1_RHYFE|nr:hypothetical protein GWI33_015813 [Rhynchophorus ferrugineus]
MSVKKSQSQFSLRNSAGKRVDGSLSDTTARILYKLALTVWHVSFHIENKHQNKRRENIGKRREDKLETPINTSGSFKEEVEELRELRDKQRKSRVEHKRLNHGMSRN